MRPLVFRLQMGKVWQGEKDLRFVSLSSFLFRSDFAILEDSEVAEERKRAMEQVQLESSRVKILHPDTASLSLQLVLERGYKKR